MNYKKFDKEKRDEELKDFNLEKYIDDMESYRKECKIRDLIEMFRMVEKEEARLRDKLRKELLNIPIIQVRVVNLDKINPRTDKKQMKIDWEWLKYDGNNRKT